MNPGDFDGGSVCQYKGSACGQCWALSGPGGSANIQVTDCCAGYPGNPSCLSPQGETDGMCDWCAANDNQHFDLDWNSYATVCGNQVDAGHCVISSARQIGCPSNAVADLATADPSLASPTDPTSTSQSSPTWAVALIVLSSLVLFLLLVVVVLLFIRIRSKEERV